jgi:FMN phosphatase YigB (HAD superfamily)
MRPAVVLDLDDTLVATYQHAYRKTREASRLLGLRQPGLDAFRLVYGSGTFADCVQALHPGVDLGAYTRCYDGLADQFPDHALCPVEPLVEAARKNGWSVGILTNGPAAKTTRKLRSLDISVDQLDFVLSADEDLRKPHPRAFERLRSEACVELTESWYVSDSPEDWAGAAACGLGTVAVLAPWNARPAIQRHDGIAQLVVRNVRDLADVLPWLGTPSSRPTAPTAAVTFDAGFTLLDERRSPAELVRETLAAWDSPPTETALVQALDECRHLLGSTEEVWTSDVSIALHLSSYYSAVLARVAPHVAADAIEAGQGEITRRYTHVENWAPRPGVSELLGRAHRHQRVGVLSNWSSSLAQVLEETGLDERVDRVLASAVLGVAKPSPRAFLDAAEALAVPVDRLVHVGDDPRADVGGALGAGARAIYAPVDASPTEVMSMLEVAL